MLKVAINKNRQENVFDPPYSLKDGDILCVFEPPPTPAPTTITTPAVVTTAAVAVADSSALTPAAPAVAPASPPAVAAPPAVALPIISRPEDLYMQPQIEAIQAALKAMETTVGRKPAKDRRVGLSANTPYQRILSTYPLSFFQRILSTYPLSLYRRTLSIYPINTSYQRTLRVCLVSSLSTLFKHTHPLYTIRTHRLNDQHNRPTLWILLCPSVLSLAPSLPYPNPYPTLLFFFYPQEIALSLGGDFDFSDDDEDSDDDVVG